MRTVSYRLGDLARATINIGKVAENEYTRVQFNAEQIFAEYPAATPSMAVISPAGVKYPAVVTREADLIIWDVTDADLTAEGMGELQLTLTENGVVCKSYIARTRIERSIVADGEAPDPVQNWLDQAAEVLEAVEDAIPAGGTQGQVMGKLSDDDYDIGWIDQTGGGGGGGGTTNYNDLSNKPQIAGTTLSGNKTLAQLGIAAASDIPDVSGFYTKPQSGIPASDLADGVIPDVSGLYTKPSGGIPKSDLESGVQTSLGKADTAYQKPAGGIPASDIADGVIPDVSGFYTKPASGIPASDIADGVIPTVHNVPAGGSANQVLAKNSGTDYDLKWVNQSGGGGGAEIDDTAGEGDTDVVWSADKTWTETEALKEAIVPLTPAATSGDVGKFLKAKTVSGGKVTEYEFGSASGGSVTVDDELSNSSTNPVQNKVITGALSGKYVKPSGGIPAEDIASGVIPDVSGFYTKPSGGIPSTDMASAVQSSLGKADSAYQKPGTGIPATDLASGVIPAVHNVPSGGSANQVLAKNSGTDYDLKWVNQSGGGGGVEIDDTAGIGDTTVTWSANKSATEIANLIPAAPETISWIDKTYINSSGVAETDNSYQATDYIDITDAVAISYAGRVGSSASCFWYNSGKTFLSSSLTLSDRTAYYENVLVYKPENAKYLRVQSKKTTATNPPAVTPEVTVFYDPNYVELLAENIVGDGETDDTNAVQRIVNVGESVVFPKRGTILISGTIDVRMGYARILDGNGCNIVVDDNFYALSVTGTLTGSTEATGMPTQVVEAEAGMVIKNFRITAEDPTEGGGIEITKSFKLKVFDNYIHHMKNGIRVYGKNRDMIFGNNQMITFTNNGILFDQNSNVHQCNIVNNILEYAHDVIHLYDPYAIANFQIVGNDIEIINYPSNTAETATCINFESPTVEPEGGFGEIEICGNTIQGHETSFYLLNFAGHASELIRDVSIVGNQISNSKGTAIYLGNCINFAISGNTIASIWRYVYELAGTVINVSIHGDSARNINTQTVATGGKLHAASGSVLSGVKCKNVLFTNDTVSIEASSITDVDVWDEKDITVSGSTPTISAVPNARYICGEVSSLSFTPCGSGVCEVIFTSGSTPTSLTVPITVKWSDDFDPSNLDASTTYALNILNGTMGVAAKWA